MTEVQYNLVTRVVRGNKRPKTEAQSGKMYKGKPQGQLQSWILVWFIVTAIICIWDATFIVLRPHTLPGGSLHWFWAPYRLYITLDQRYMDTTDAFVYAQSLLNYLEVILNIITLIMHHKQSKHTIVVAFTVSVMTFWKTVLYLLMFTDFVSGGEYKQKDAFISEIFLVWIPNGVWCVLPFAVVISLWSSLTIQSLEARETSSISTHNCSTTHQDGQAHKVKSKVR